MNKDQRRNAKAKRVKNRKLKRVQKHENLRNRPPKSIDVELSKIEYQLHPDDYERIGKYVS